MMRALIHAHGPDTTAFLQGLITANINAIGSSSRTALYSAMLTPKGRIMHDVFLFKHPANGIWIDCHRDAHSAVYSYLKRHKLRSSVTLDVTDSHKVVALRQQNNLDPQQSSFSIDPRLQLLGYRAIVPSDMKIQEEVSEDEYKKMRFKLGIAEGPHELRSGVYLPHEVNLDYLNALDYKKGCYVGQELVIRTHHQGVIRKRLVPVTLDESSSKNIVAADSEVTCDGKKMGKIVASFGNLGLAILKLDALSSKQPLQVATENGNSIITPQPTTWWPSAK